jgi:hypothetical protein
MSYLQQDASNVISALKTTKNAAQVGSAITSIAIIWIASYSRFVEFLPKPWAMAWALSIVLLALGVMELGLRTFLPFVFDELFAWRMKREDTNTKRTYRFLFLLVCCLLCAILATGTGGTSWLGRIDMVEAATPPPQTADLENLRQDQNRLLQDRGAEFDQRIAEAKRSEKARVKAAKKEATRLLTAAKNSKGQKMASLAASGNGWARLQLQKAVSDAKTKGDQLIELEKGKVDALRRQKDQELASIRSKHVREFNDIKQQGQQVMMSYQSRFSRNTMIVGLFGVGCLVIFVICNLLLSWYRIIEDQPTFHKEKARKITGSFSMPDLGFSRPAPDLDMPKANASGPVGYPTAGGNFSAQSGNFSPKSYRSEEKVTAPESYREAEKIAASAPDNRGKSYRKRKDVIENEIAVKTAWEELKHELNKMPTVAQVCERTGISDRTARKIINRLNLRENYTQPVG